MLPMVAVVNEVSPKQTLFPRVVTLSGIVTSVNEVQARSASVPIDVTESGMPTVLSAVLFFHSLAAIVVVKEG